MRKWWLMVWVLCSACSSSNPVAPAQPAPVPQPPPVLACQANNTALAKFGNRSVDTAMDVFWDGNKVATLAIGQDSQPFTVAAGVAHTLEFKIMNSPNPACLTSSPVPATCGMPLYTCNY